VSAEQIFPITPETRVGDLLDHYPEIEKELLALSPAFGKLRNPVLRKTIARVTTLRHAAKVGKISLATLINHLRRAVGHLEEFSDDQHAQGNYYTSPARFAEEDIYRSLDVRPLLASGVKPVGKVMADLKDLPDGRVYELIAPFLPAPLIDLAGERGYEVWCGDESADPVKIFFRRRREQSDQLVDLE
jgi:hypothetical protein